MAVGCYFVIFGCLCPGCGRVVVYLSFARCVVLGFGRFACWPCMWGLVEAGSHCVMVVAFPSFWGGRLLPFFSPVFPSFGGAYPAGVGYMMVLV